MITIVDYGMGNLNSIANMLKRVKIECIISSDLEVISKAKKIILPGVGAFDSAMIKIQSSELSKILNYKSLKEKIPILGICLGMQLLTNSSEEGELPGFGWIDAETISFKNRINNELRIPHMGWNSIKTYDNSFLSDNLQTNAKFYFVHSYFVKVKNKKNTLFSTTYGIEFDSAIVQDNIFGVQFHPEKSHKFGMTLLKNFGGL